MGRKVKERDNEDCRNGFAEWGGYMAAKRAKLMDQFHNSTKQNLAKVSDIFHGIAIHVNGITHPTQEELKLLMAAHGGLFHMYPVNSTTHIIASNLPNVKIKQLGSVPVVKPSWITDSIDMGKLLDYKRYLLYTNQSVTQPRIDFPTIPAKVFANNNETVLESESIEEEKSVTHSNTRIENSASRITKTASDPQFLEEFYNNSRLHLIATLGAEYKQLVCQLRDKSDGSFPGKDMLLKLNKSTNLNLISDTIIMHIDMDCFFVSVGLKKHPELKGKPVAVTHARNGQIFNTSSVKKADRELELALYQKNVPAAARRTELVDSTSSLSEIASCSYEARKMGVKNGMFLGVAVKLCPDLKTIPYDFEGYKEVSNTLYKTIASYTLDIEAVSCDEMYVDVTKILRETGLSVDEWATHIRNEIIQATGCPCSTGFGANRLQARLATKKAKPNGQFHLLVDDVEMYMSNIPVADLPGVGRATLTKLENLSIKTCGDLQRIPLKTLQHELGNKYGESLLEQAKGIDKKPLNYYHERKSVSAEVNYGIRFKTVEECHRFFESLSNEVFHRLAETGLRSRCLTLKLMIRANDAPVETAKFLGHGYCDSISKSNTFNTPINDAATIFKTVKEIYSKLNISYLDLRGIGIQLSKLEKPAALNKVLLNFLHQKSNKNLNIENTALLKNEKNYKNEINTINDSTNNINNKDLKFKRESKKEQLFEKSLNHTIHYYLPKCTKVRKIINKPLYKDISSKIDLSVLNELPKDLRDEVIENYELEKNYLEASNLSQIKQENITKNIENRVSPNGNIGSSIIETETTNISNRKNTKKGKDLPFSKLSWNEMKLIIKNWINSEEKPSESDIKLIGNWFRDMALDRKIEILQNAFNYLHRILSERNCDWHQAYFNIVCTTQSGMQKRYGSPLLVCCHFKCCS